MNITINGKLAVLKEKTSFEIISENRDFSGADSYSMTITFPLKDCPQNAAIFGYINRKDVDKSDILLDCVLQDKSFSMRGSLAITQIDEVEVKTQFLEGRSANNYVCSFDSIYINELELGYPDTDPTKHPVNRDNSDATTKCYTALPWVNNSSGNIQNDINLSMSGATWKATKLSFQPFMIYLVKLMFNKLGYTYDLSKWESSNYSKLLCCNTLPAAWDLHNWAKALPHWTMTEFLEQLELLMNCEFDVDHSQKTVSFAFTREKLQSLEATQLKVVLDDYEVSKVEVSDCSYRGAVNLKYAECTHRMWKYYCNPAFIKFWKTKAGTLLNYEYDTIAELSQFGMEHNYQLRYDNEVFVGAISRLWYCKDVDRYVIARATGFVKDGETTFEGDPLPYGHYFVMPQIFNFIAPRIVDENATTKELKIVPAWIDDVAQGKGQVFFLELPDYAGESGSKPYNGFDNWDEAIANLGPEPDYVLRTMDIDSGEEEEYIDKIYVGFWANVWQYERYEHPYIDVVNFNADWSMSNVGWSLSLKSDTFNQYTEPEKIDPTLKFTFKFLSEIVPNPRSLFYIFGKCYICEKIITTFTENGMSQLMKGVFWQVKTNEVEE